MKRLGFFICVGLMTCSLLSFGQETYQWMDEKGTIHFTDDPGLIPEKYRDKVLEKKPPKEPTPSQSDKASKGSKIEKKPEPALERKDLLGRGEEWWRDKAREWNKKLLNAQKNYETAYAAWKAKEKEFDEAKFKPKSLKRKLDAEMKTLEEKAYDWKKQVDEAKNMLEKVLPKQAEEYQADPAWVKIE
jgi:hypothetical protein